MPRSKRCSCRGIACMSRHHAITRQSSDSECGVTIRATELIHSYPTVTRLCNGLMTRHVAFYAPKPCSSFGHPAQS